MTEHKDLQTIITNMKHTIFTPVYNRANNMLGLAKHIAEISYPKSEFEWLIIDDGSTDNLKDVVSQIVAIYPDLVIRSIHKENGVYIQRKIVR